MNEDHSDSTIAMVKHYAGVTSTEAEIISLDRLGMTVSGMPKTHAAIIHDFISNACHYLRALPYMIRMCKACHML